MILIDPPNAAGHGRLWSHLASDASYEELHAFAATLGIPPRGFDRDHYDVPAERYGDVVAAGATPVAPRALGHLRGAAGLRRRKRGTPCRPGPWATPPRGPSVRDYRSRRASSASTLARAGRSHAARA